MFIERNPWVVVVGSVVTAMAIYIAGVGVRQVDAADLFGNFLMYGVIFVAFAVIALVVYRYLRRSRAPAVMDEAKTAHGQRVMHS